MIITTKYGISDVVYKITRGPTQKWATCPACEGSGRITLKNGERSCPECYGRRGKTEYGLTTWHVEDGTLTIGQVRAYVQNFKKSGMFDNIGAYAVGSDSQKVEYMCYETGIGSGNIHYEETLWPSRELAQAECDRLNANDEQP